MKIAGLAIVGILITLMIITGAQRLASAVTGPTASQIAADLARADRIRADSALYATWAPISAALLNVGAYVVTLGLFVYLGALGAAHVHRNWYERRPDNRGLLPVLASDQNTARAALASFHMARIEESRRPLVPTSPATFTYSPHVTGALAAPAALAALAAPAGALAAPPSFAQLLNAGQMGKGQPLLLGFDRESGAAVEGSWLDLYSCAVGGLSGSGKSWTACFLAAQAALHGARIVLLDPHADNPESLASRLAPMAASMLCEPADTARTMLDSVRLVAGELERRLAGHKGAPWLFVADEFSSLQRGELAEPLAALVEALGQEGRKLGMFAMICGHVWSGSRAGGTELRDSLASAYVHRLRPAQARMLTGLTAADLPGDLISLPAGSAYLLSTAGDLRPVIIPHMTPADIVRVAQLADGTPNGSPMDAKVEQASRSLIRPEAAHALQLFREGLDLPQIVKELRGVESSGGRRYQDAAREIQRLLREALA